MISNLFNELLSRPLLNLLVLLYENITFFDLGLAIIVLTIIIRIVLFPLFHKIAYHQRLTQKIQPKIKEIQKKYKKDREKQTKAIMALYGEHKINPLTPFLLIILQLPVLLALFWVFREGFSEEALVGLYSFVPQPEVINNTLLGLIDLNERSMIIVVVAAAAQFIQGKLAAAPKEGADPKMANIAKQMVVIGPVMAFVVLLFMPAAIGLYWLTSTTFSIFQQIFLDKRLKEAELKKAKEQTKEQAKEQEKKKETKTEKNDKNS